MQQKLINFMKTRLQQCFESPQAYVKKATSLLREIAASKNKDHMKEIVQLCKQWINSPAELPMRKLCSAKLLKDLFDLAIFPLIKEIESNILLVYADIVEYRCHIPSMSRGSTIFLQKIVKSVNFQEQIKQNISIGNNFFTMVHQCLMFWAKFIPNEKRSFKQVYDKLSKYCTFPTQLKYFKANNVESYHKRLKEQEDAIEYEIEELVTIWQQNIKKMANTSPSDPTAKKTIHNISIDCEEFALNFHDRMEQIEQSLYYDKENLKIQLQKLRKQMKEFYDLERIDREAKNNNSIVSRYFGKNQHIQKIRRVNSEVSEQNLKPPRAVDEIKESQPSEYLQAPIKPQTSRMVQSDHTALPSQPLLSENDYTGLKTVIPKASKPQRVKKPSSNSNNLPQYRSVIYQPAKQSFSLAECDTMALDAVTNLKEQHSTTQNGVKPILKTDFKQKSDNKSEKSKGSKVAFQPEVSMCQIESMSEKSVVTNNRQHEKADRQGKLIKEKRKTSADETFISNKKENSDTKNISEQSPPIKRLEIKPMPIKTQNIVHTNIENSRTPSNTTHRANYSDQQNIRWNPIQKSKPVSKAFNQAMNSVNQPGKLSKAKAVQICIQNTFKSVVPEKIQTKMADKKAKSNYRFVRMLPVKVCSQIHKKQQSVETISENKPNITKHHLYDINLFSKTQDTKQTQCQTEATHEKQQKSFETTMVSRSRPRKNSFSIMRSERSFSGNRKSLSNKQHSYPIDSVLGLLYSRREIC